MRKTAFLAFHCLATVSVMASLLAVGPGAGAREVREDKFTLKARPSAAPKKPVDVYAVTLTPPELEVTEVRVRNLADRRVDSIVLRWRIVSQRSPDAVLSSGRTPPLAVKLDPGEARKVEFDVVSFREEYARLGRPEGQFLILVTGSEYRFSSPGHGVGSLGRAFAAIPKPITVATAPALAPAFDAPCQYSDCEWIGQCFVCSGSEGPFYCETTGQCPLSCTSARCELEIQ